VYLTAVLGFDRKVIGWAFSAAMKTVRMTLPVRKTAVANRHAREGLRFHADRGVWYCVRAFREALQEPCPTVRQRMNRGIAPDFAGAQTFFKTLKGELETLAGRHSEEEIRGPVFSRLEA
jgi:transposase InsO family protein